MSYCLNPRCSSPHNPHDARFCLSCGTRLLLGDRYRALMLIGEGGFGRTFQGIDEYKPSRPACAIKQFMPLDQGLKQGEKALELFHQEASRLDELGRHPQIPELQAHFTQDQRQYLVQEFIAGPTLAAELAAMGPFREAQVRQLLLDLLPVLEFIHQHQVIHRDIKPENIIRRQSDQKLVLVDFGAARFATATLLHQSGTVIGSVGYSAPEQLLGRAVYASDLYSLGVTCIHLLTQIPPFDLFDSTQDLWNWRESLPQPISPVLGRILDGLLERATNRRYASAMVVLQELRSHFPPVPPPTSQPGSAPVGPSPRSPVASVTPCPGPPPLWRSVSAPAPPSQLWRCRATLRHQTSPVETLVLTPDGQTLISGNQDGTIKLWDLETLKLNAMLGSRSGATLALALTPDGQTLISGNQDGSIHLWDLETGEFFQRLRGHTQAVRSLVLSGDGQILISGSSDHTIKRWQLPQGELLAAMTTEATVYSLALHPQEFSLASGGYDRKIKLWHLTTGTLQQTLRWQLGPVYAIALSPGAVNLPSGHGHLLAAGDEDGTIKLWHWGEREPWGILTKHRRAIHALCFSPDSQLLASGGEDYLIKLWHLPTGQAIATLADHTQPINSLVFSPNGQTLISGSCDRTIRIWELR